MSIKRGSSLSTVNTVMDGKRTASQAIYDGDHDNEETNVPPLTWTFDTHNNTKLVASNGDEVDFDSLQSLSTSISGIRGIYSSIHQDLETLIVNGVVTFDNVHVDISGCIENLLIVVALMDQKKMVVFEEEMGALKLHEGIVVEGILYLNAARRRWEGYIMDGIPFGYGILFDERRRRVYEGFMYGHRRVAYGEVFYPIKQSVYYKGDFCDNQFFGNGEKCDEDGNLVYSGTWMFDEAIDDSNIPFCDSLFDGMDSECIIANGEMISPRYQKFQLSPLLFNLKHIKLSCNSLWFVNCIVIDSLPNLEVFECDEYNGLASGMIYRGDGVCIFRNCPLLRQIVLTEGIFRDFIALILENLGKLTSLTITGESFVAAKDFVLQSTLWRNGGELMSRPSQLGRCSFERSRIPSLSESDF